MDNLKNMTFGEKSISRYSLGPKRKALMQKAPTTKYRATVSLTLIQMAIIKCVAVQLGVIHDFLGDQFEKGRVNIMLRL